MPVLSTIANPPLGGTCSIHCVYIHWAITCAWTWALWPVLCHCPLPALLLILYYACVDMRIDINRMPYHSMFVCLYSASIQVLIYILQMYLINYLPTIINSDILQTFPHPWRSHRAIHVWTFAGTWPPFFFPYFPVPWVWYRYTDAWSCHTACCMAVLLAWQLLSYYLLLLLARLAGVYIYCLCVTHFAFLCSCYLSIRVPGPEAVLHVPAQSCLSLDDCFSVFLIGFKCSACFV